MLSSVLVLLGSTLVLCGLNTLLLIFCRSEWRHSVNGGRRTTICGWRGQRWWLDQSTKESGGGGIRPHLLHQSLPGQQRQRCHDLHMTLTWPSHHLHITYIWPQFDFLWPAYDLWIWPLSDLYMTVKPHPYDLCVTISDLLLNMYRCWSLTSRWTLTFLI